MLTMRERKNEREEGRDEKDRKVKEWVD